MAAYTKSTMCRIDTPKGFDDPAQGREAHPGFVDQNKTSSPEGTQSIALGMASLQGLTYMAIDSLLPGAFFMHHHSVGWQSICAERYS